MSSRVPAYWTSPRTVNASYLSIEDRVELLELLLAEGLEWVERPVETADDGALCMWWIERTRAVLKSRLGGCG